MNTPNKQQPVVLYVENNPDDMFFLERQVKKSDVCFRLLGASDVRSALDSLRGGHVSKLGAALLDYTLDSGRTGLEVLRWIRQQPGLRELPVIMYSSGEMPEIVATCYREGAQYFIHKCPNLDRVRDFVQCLDDSLRLQPASFERLLRLKDYAPPNAAAPGLPCGKEPGRLNSN